MGASPGTLGTMGIILTPSHHASPRETHGPTQCAAVSTHCGWMREPPQKCIQKLDLNLRLTCQGHLLSEASCSPTMPARSLAGPGERQETTSVPCLAPSELELSLGVSISPFLWPVKVRERGWESSGQLTRGCIHQTSQEGQRQQQLQHLEAVRSAA